MAERVTHIFSCPDIITQLASSSGGALVSWRQEGVSAGLRSVAAKLNEIVCVEDFVQSGDADDTLRIQRAAAEIRARGGGTLWFKHGKTYAVWTDNAQSIIIDLSNTRGVTIEGNGAHIQSARTVAANGNSILIYCAPVNGLVVRNLKFTGTSNTGALPVIASEGERFLNWATASTNILVENVDIRNCLNGPQCIADNGKNRGVTIRNMYCYRVFYPLSTWCTDDVDADYTAIECGRAYFPTSANGYGCNNHNITIYSVRGYADVEMLFGLSAIPNASLTTDKRNELTNIKVRYKSPGKAVGAGNGSSALVQFGLQQLTAVSGASANTGGFNIANIDIEIDVDGRDIAGGSTNPPYRIFNITKRDSAGSADATGRGYKIDNIRVHGIARNWQNATVGGGVVLFDVSGGESWAAGAGPGTADEATNISFEDFVVMNSGAASNVPFTVNGQAAVAGTSFLHMDRLRVQGNLSYINCDAARIYEGDIYFANLDAARAYTPVWTDAGAPPPDIGNGTLVGYRHREGQYDTVTVAVTPGGTTTFGAGAYELTLPSAVDVVGVVGELQMGVCRYFENGVAVHTGVCFTVQTTNRLLLGFNSPAAGWAATIPGTFKNGDVVTAQIRYRNNL